ncbi:uncharacterized protein PV09_02509 [Verruconis gallopava]|uniref:SnoaL-like domain-containing protein n=1 Tax=Verruconis gallopava TaxID=253628 RepID=A0A0D2B6G4_9PEZI|nr:uncharacterized protein PV09_02509 [Verruconis gallopava]KIW06829.1 hypothetical protein PV09_02509 [Verruconis gallopava]
MASQYPISITGLSPRDAVIDALHRSILAIDSGDVALFQTCMFNSPETTFKIVGGRTVQGSKAIEEHMVNTILPLSTLHSVTNIRVSFPNSNPEEAKEARLTANAIAYHYRPEDAFKPEHLSFTTGGMYDIEMLKDESDGLWKAKTWTLKLNWTEGDRAAIFG